MSIILGAEEFRTTLFQSELVPLIVMLRRKEN